MAKTPKTDDDDAGDDAPQYVTVEQLNAAIAGKLGEFQKRIPKMLEPILAPLSAQLGEIGTLITGQAADKDKADKDKAKDPEVMALRKQTETQAAALKAMDDERKAERATNDRNERKDLLRSALVKAKVSDALLPAAVTHLEGSVSRAEDGRIVFRRQNSYGVAEEIEVGAAVTDWTRTDEGKAFVAPRKAQGSGTVSGGAQQQRQAPQQGPKAGSPEAEAARVQAAKRELASAFLGVPGAADDSD